MPKWEYATVPLLVHATKQILDNWGDDGWELVAVIPGPNSEQLVAYLKRERAVSSAAERLAALGLTLPPVTAPVAAVRARGADRPVRLHRGPAAGGGRETARHRQGRADRSARRDAAGLARTCALNALAAAAAAAGGLDAISRIVKVTGFVASAPGFNGQPQVINGASELLIEVFGEAGRHARSAVGVAVLPLDAPVEVELIAEVRAECA